MSIDYNLDVSTGLGPSQIRALLELRFHIKSIDDTHLIGHSTWVAVGEKKQLGRELMQEAFGFRPDVVVTFVPQAEADDEWADSYRFMLRATIFLLDHCKDAVLLFNGEIIVLQRIGGKLVLNADYNIWTEGYTLEGEVDVPHEKRSLPSPLL